MNTKIRWRLTTTYLSVIVVTMTVIGCLLSYVIEHQLVREVEIAMRAHAKPISDRVSQLMYKNPKLSELNDLCQVLARQTKLGVTVYDRHGLVLCNTETPDLRDVGPTPISTREFRSGFGCLICHTEMVKRKTQILTVPLRHKGVFVGTLRLSASLFEAERAAGRTRRVIVAGTLLVGIIVALVTVKLAGSISEPIGQMNRMAHEMSLGNLGQRVKVDSRDEIGQLAVSLNRMADSLEAYLDDLSEERDRMETILNSIGDGIVVTDEKEKVTLVNAPAERLFGMHRTDMIGSQVETLTPVCGLSYLVRSALSENRVIRREVRTEIPADRILNVRVAPVHDRKGQIAGTVCLLQDMSGTRRHAEIQKDFVANVSHELRTPVASIRAIVGALQSGALDDPDVAARFVSSLDAETERLSLLLNDLLNLSELDAGKTGRKYTTVSVREVAEEVVDNLADQIRQRGVYVSVDIPESITLRADRLQILQVLQNLVDNAVKYTGSGGTIGIKAFQSENEVTLKVQDTGIGIPPGDLDRIFERFYRVDKARSRQLGGTGLGLSIVKDIVDLYDGRIVVESKVGKGSTFTVVLPKFPPDSVS